jgi:hypothetical protein
VGRVNLIELTLAPSFNIWDTPGAFGTCNAMFTVKITLIQNSFKIKTNFLKVRHKLVPNLGSTKNSPTKLSNSDNTVLVVILRNRILNYTIRYNVYVHLWITEYLSRYTTDALAIFTCTSLRIKASAFENLLTLRLQHSVLQNRQIYNLKRFQATSIHFPSSKSVFLKSILIVPFSFTSCFVTGLSKSWEGRCILSGSIIPQTSYWTLFPYVRYQSVVNRLQRIAIWIYILILITIFDFMS